MARFLIGTMSITGHVNPGLPIARKLVERGLASRVYEQGRFSVKRENGVHHFHGLVYEYLTR
jgi:hypothetical protein